MPLSGPHRLIAFLALHPGAHERDALAARFWPDLPTARANLRTAVWALRRALGADVVHATRTPTTRAALARLRGPVDGPRLPAGGAPLFGRAAELAALASVVGGAGGAWPWALHGPVG